MLFFACEELLAIKNSQSSILLGAKFGSSSAKNHKSNNGKYQDGKSILIRILKRIIQSASRHYRGLIYSFLVQVFCAYRLYSGMSNKSVDGKINRFGWISRHFIYFGAPCGTFSWPQMTSKSIKLQVSLRISTITLMFESEINDCWPFMAYYVIVTLYTHPSARSILASNSSEPFWSRKIIFG